MKSKEELLSMMYCTLAELQSGCTDSNPGLNIYLRHRLEFLYEILGDEVPEEYWGQIEDALREPEEM